MRLRLSMDRFRNLFLATVICLGILGVEPASARAQAVSLTPQVIQPNGRGVSPPLRDLPGVVSTASTTVRELRRLPHTPAAGTSALAQAFTPDAALQTGALAATMPAPLQNFDGLGNLSQVLPPDPEGDIGFDPGTGTKYYVQWINLIYAVWDVTTTPKQILSPRDGTKIWESLGTGNLCATNGQGDPIVLFDSQAQRWFFSQFAFTLDLLGNPVVPSYQCIAVSKTADPTGAFSLYSYPWPGNKFNDYAKWGIWPDAYYMSANQFTGVNFAGSGVAAFDRTSMLAGAPNPGMVYFDLADPAVSSGGMLPADLDGSTPPPAGAKAIFLEVDDSATLGSVDAMRVWTFHVDWTSASKASFGTSTQQPDLTLPVTPYNPLPCEVPAAPTRNCIPQPGNAPALDAVADRLMYRLAYRNFGDHEALVVNHTVWADGKDRAGIRWYELRSTGGAWSIFQQGTFAPADGNYRWMGSIAMDHMGNIAVGYAVAGPNTYPSIRYAGRLAADPAGELAQGEASIVEGAGAQMNPTARWGDYSMMGIDPQDDCTFWYTQEYMPTTGNANWQTRIAAFRFPNCTKAVAPPPPYITYFPIVGK